MASVMQQVEHIIQVNIPTTGRRIRQKFSFLDANIQISTEWDTLIPLQSYPKNEIKE